MGGAGSDNTRNFFLCSAALLRAAPELWAPQRRVVLVAPGATAWAWLPGLVHAAYLFGQVAAAPGAWRVAGGLRFVVGEWQKPVEVFVAPRKPLAEALQVALRFEEDDPRGHGL